MPLSKSASSSRHRTISSSSVYIFAATLILGASIVRFTSSAAGPESAVLQNVEIASDRLGGRHHFADAYGNLPLSFAANRGQADSRVRFIARGLSYSLYLTADEAIFALRSGSSAPTAKGNGPSFETLKVLRMKLIGANRKARSDGLDPLPGKLNYIIGNDSSKWRKNIPTYSQVRYRNVYPGIDLVYHGSQKQLEYDFRIAPGSLPQRIKIGFEGIQKAAIDGDGNLVLSTTAGDVSQHKPVAYQEIDGMRREVAVHYKLDGNKITFETGGYDKKQPLIIDPVFMYSSFLGGASTEQGLGIAVDAQGNAYLTGRTNSTDFPLAGPAQNAKGSFLDAFVAKLNPSGTGLVYATYLGGNGDDIGNAIAIDAQGSAYVVGSTGSGSFPITAGAAQNMKDDSLDAFVTKLSASGSSLLYSTFLGGDNTDNALAVAVDGSGRAHVAGRTDSTRFRVPFSTPRHGSPLFKSSDNADHWLPSATDLTDSTVNVLGFDPSNSNVIYAGSNNGVFKSVDAGAHWGRTGTARTSTAPTFTLGVAVDPSNPSVVYAATSAGIYKSIDGGSLYDQKNNGLLISSINALAIDPTTPNTLYAGGVLDMYKSINGGENWTTIDNGLSGSIQVSEIAIDPTNPAIIYIGTVSNGLYKSTNGGASWSAINSGLSNVIGFQINALAIDPVHPSTLYVAYLSSLYKTTNGGTTWTSSSTGLTTTVNGQSFVPNANSLAVDPVTPANVYAATSPGGMFKSTDGGANWSQSNVGLTNMTANAIAINPSNPSVLYAGTSIGNDAFAVRLNAAGTALEYVVNFGGDENDAAGGVALDAAGNAYVVGTTRSQNFPLLNGFQSALGGFADAFVTKINVAGTGFEYSTYLGGTSDETGRAIAVKDGSAYVTGQTASADYPLVNAFKGSLAPFDADAFVTKVNLSGSSLDFSTYLGGTGLDQGLGIAVGADGSVYVTGVTGSQDFPTLSAPQPSPGGNFSNDAFVTKLNSAGAALVYSTYLGGSNSDQGNGVAVDSNGSAYVIGTTFSSNFPTVSPFQSVLKGGDAFVTKLASSLDLQVTMSDSPDPVPLGSDLTYTINVKNNGELPGTGVALSDTLPAGATLVSAISNRGTCSGTISITCLLGTMNGGEQATVQIVIKPPALSSISNTATVTSNETDPVPSNNTATVQTQVDFADLLVTGAAAFGRVAPSGRINYLFNVKNLSGKTTGPVLFTNNLPAETTFVSCSALGGVCGGSGNNRTVTFTSLAVGQSAAIVLVATVNPSVAEGTILNNTATVSSTTPDPDSLNNSTTVIVTATSAPLLKKLNGLVAFATSQILTVKADGSEAPKPFPGLALGILPRWSPDGAKLAFTIAKNRTVYPFDTITEIDVVNADGTGLMTLADNSIDTSFNNRSQFAWSPDGTRVAYVGNDKMIYLANADGSGYVKLPNSPSQLRDLDWSADGSRFVFSKDLGEIYIMNVDGSGLTKLVPFVTGPNGTTQFVGPRWSPDTKRILFSGVTNGGSEIFIMNSDGTGQQHILNHGSTFAPTWSPDGGRLGFYNGTDIYVIDLDGTDEIRLTTGQDCCLFGSMDWQPVPTNTPLPPTDPPAPSLTISGKISDTNGMGTGVILKLSGTRTGFAGSDSAGNYTFVNLEAGGTYTITPTSAFFKFTPASRTVTNLHQNQTGIDFVVSSSISYTIKGRLTDTQGQGVGGQPISLFRFGTRRDATTDGQGFYSFTNIFPGDGYQIIPLSLTYTFDPVASFPQSVFSDMTINFVGALNDSVRSLGGRITDSGGRSLAGQLVNLNGARQRVVKTNVDGQFSFADLPVGQNYTITPSTAGGFVFSPPQQTFTNLNANQSVSFTAIPLQPTVQFSAPSYTVSESGRAVEITLTRTGDLSASGTVDYLTSDMTASERTDYTAAYGTLRFGPGESSRTFSVLVSDDVFVEGARTFLVTLANGSGVAVGFPAPSAMVIITDDDVTGSVQNPVDDAAFFVRQHYADFLNRVPDDAGLAFWVDQITSCGADAACRDIRRINVSAAFFLSIEFQETGYLVYRVHYAAFGTAERLRIKNFLRDTQEIGRGVVVGVGNWQQQLEANKRAFMEDFVLRQEFISVYPLSMSPAQFVNSLNANTSGALSTSERDALVAELTSGAKSRGEVLRAVAENAQVFRQQSNRAFVLMQYFGYLRRNPDDPPDSDFAGHAFWLDKLTQFNGNFINAEMVNAFLVSGEYRSRFGAP